MLSFRNKMIKIPYFSTYRIYSFPSDISKGYRLHISVKVVISIKRYVHSLKIIKDMYIKRIESDLKRTGTYKG